MTTPTPPPLHPALPGVGRTVRAPKGARAPLWARRGGGPRLFPRGQSLGGGLWPGAQAPGEGGPDRVSKLTALVLLHDVHHVTRGQRHLRARTLLIVSDGAVRLQDDGARDVWAEGGQGEWTRWAPPPHSPLRALGGSPGWELMSCPHPAPDRPGVDTPCVLESSRDKLGFAALRLFSTCCVPDTGHTLYTRSLSFDEVCKQPFSTLMCTGDFPCGPVAKTPCSREPWV